MVAKTKTKKSLTEEYISSVVEKPHLFFSVNPKLVEQSISLTKHLFDTAKDHQVEEFSPFTELLTEGFDHDQIWEELVTQNEPFLHYCKKSLKHWSKPTTWATETDSDGLEEDNENVMDHLNHHSDDSHDGLSDTDGNDDESEGQSALEEEDDEQDSVASLTDGDMVDEDEDDNEDFAESTSALGKPSEVDDDFFNLEAFNKWTEQQEALDMESDQEDDDDDAIDFDNDLGALEDDEDDEDDNDLAQDISYNDFFLPPSKPSRTNGTVRKVKFANNADEEEQEQDRDEDMDTDDEEQEEDTPKVRGLFDDDENEAKSDQKSAHERQQERLKAQIEQFEQENIEGRHWTLKGEASVKSRPVNSLLEEDMEFDHSVKPVPVITQETTNVLEDLIKKRITEDNFDDVERKSDPTARPWLPSKRVELVDTQSKKSLADLYEEDFVKKSAGDQSNEKDEALQKEHGEISNMFSTLCEKLDALSNFHFTPKAAKAELSVVSNAASISMEEIIPVNVSDATLLAPEEVYDKKPGEVKDQSEMDQDERRRARKQKKMMKRKENALKEKESQLLAKSRPASSGGYVDRKSKTKAVKELIGQKNVTVIGKDGKKMKQDKTVTSASLF